MKTLNNIYRLFKLCLSSRAGKVGLIIFIIVFALQMLGVKLSIALIEWNKTFYDALEQRNVSVILPQVGVYFIIVFMTAGQSIVGQYLQKKLRMRWRTTLTEKSLNYWLSSKAYWYMDSHVLDNPDQRIAEDCRLFIDRLTTDGLQLLTKIIGLVSFVVILWNLSAAPVTFTFFGRAFTVTHYMVWLAPIYVLISSIITHVLGRPLIKLNVQQQRKEGDFRFAMTRFRQSREAVALQNGENVERIILDGKMGEVVKNWNSLIIRELIIESFRRPYFLSTIVVPKLLALPMFFLGGATFGGWMQISQAFQNVTVNLSWFILSYNNLANLVASSLRLSNFLDTMESFHAKEPKTLQGNGALAFRDVKLNTEEGEQLLSLPYISIKKGSTVLVKGDSGIGKSTLLKAVAGIHHNFEGIIEVPEGKKMILSQKAYFPIGGLAHAVAYPEYFKEEDLPEIKRYLSLVGFKTEDIENRLFYYDLSKLSGGEQQRLVIARVLFNKPEWVFMDEATNALDEKSEKYLLELMQKELPESTFIIISHSDTVKKYVQDYSEISLMAD